MYPKCKYKASLSHDSVLLVWPMGCTLKSCKSWQIHNCEVQDGYMYKTCNSASSPCSFSLISHVDTPTSSLTLRGRTQLCVSWHPAICSPSGDHLHHLGADDPSCSTHASIAALSLCCGLCMHNVCVRPHTGGCSLRWQMPSSPSMAMGRDTGLNIETKLSPGKKSLNRLEMPCVHSPEADRSAWAGVSPVHQRPRAAMHMLREDTSFWGRHQAVSVGLPDTRGHSNREVCWLGSWTLQEGPSENQIVSVLVQKRNGQMLFPSSLTQLFPTSTMVNAEQLSHKL